MGLRYFISLCAFVLPPSFSMALYNGAPALPEMPEQGFFLSKDSFVSLKIGYEGDFLLGRNLDASSVSDPGMTSMVNGATLAIGFINRLEVYTVLGASTTQVSCKAKQRRTSVERLGFGQIPLFGGI